MWKPVPHQHFKLLYRKNRTIAHQQRVGVFIANADTTLVLATSGTISSEFDSLGSSGWLISSYTVAMCASQSLVGLRQNSLFEEATTYLFS
jgi:MFS family permease